MLYKFPHGTKKNVPIRSTFSGVTITVEIFGTHTQVLTKICNIMVPRSRSLYISVLLVNQLK